jgi:hypothetical protein
MLMGSAMTVYAQVDQPVKSEDKELKQSYLYQWTDEKGVVSITDDLNKVPKVYRDKALKLTQPKQKMLIKARVQPQSGHSSVSGSEAADAAGNVWRRA